MKIIKPVEFEQHLKNREDKNDLDISNEKIE